MSDTSHVRYVARRMCKAMLSRHALHLGGGGVIYTHTLDARDAKHGACTCSRSREGMTVYAVWCDIDAW
eukprot:1169551-Amorphochlora_amoeboformis.AAC.1